MRNVRTEKLGFSFWAAVLTANCAYAAAPVAEKSFRLPDFAAPTAYTLQFSPDLVKKVFDGQESINVTVKRPCSEIVLNSAEIKIKSATLEKAGGKPETLRVVPEPDFERIHFHAPHMLAEGDYTLKIKFSGILNAQLRGFYSSKFKDSKGNEHPLATTQMEPTDARRMFPCFDEPAYKAAFTISTSIDKSLVALSNSPIQEEKIEKESGKKLIKFAATPKMSTYLVALVIGPFRSTVSQTSDGVPIKVWTVSDRPVMGTYAQKCAVTFMHYYNQYFGTPYPAKKMDLIAIPDFEAGAMENLGCITFRESALLIDDQTASTPAKMRVASIVAHEMAHMWFGDLVTMKWWDDLWLNEAFATWMSKKGCDVLKPQWKVWDEFASDRVGAMATDSLLSARTIQASVNNPSEANEMFDDITYEKGASILRMLECFVGLDNFQQGIQTYIATHKFNNATTDDLWSAIGSVTKSNINALMAHWVHQAGVPLIKLSEDTGSAVTAHQERFFLVPPKDDAKKNIIWQVPLSFRAPESTDEQKKLMMDRSLTLPRPSGTYFVANAHSTGYYRVQYTPDELHTIANSIKQLEVVERLNVLSDQWSLSRAGKAAITDTLRLVEAYKRETDPTVVAQLTDILDKLSDFVTPANRKAYEKFVRDQLQFPKEELTWTAKPDDSDLRKLARSYVLDTLGTYGQDKDVIAKARSLFQQYRKDPKSVDPDLVTTITYIVAWNGSDQDYEQVVELWQKAKTPEVEKRNLMVLPHFTNPALLDRTLNMSLTEKVRTQDAPWLISSAISNEKTQDQAWQFVNKKWPQISHRFVEVMLPKMVASVGAFTTEKQEKEARDFTATHPLKTGKRRIQEALEQLHCNVLFRQKSAAELNSWLSNRGS